MTRGGPNGPFDEERLIEEAKVSSDGRSAVVVSTHYRRLLDPPVSTSADPPDDVLPLKTAVTWIDASTAGSFWTISIADNRWIKTALPISGGRGAAIATSADLNGPADLRLLGRDGVELYRMSESEGSVVSLSATPLGAFLTADLAFPDRGENVDRGAGARSNPRFAMEYDGLRRRDGQPLSAHDDNGVSRCGFPAHGRFDRTGSRCGRREHADSLQVSQDLGGLHWSIGR